LKNSIFHRIISLLLFVIFIIPIAISSFHHHEDEEHLSCDKNDLTHFHKVDIDNCTIYHYQLTTVLLFKLITIESPTISNNSFSIFNYQSFYKNNQDSLTFLRGPPYVFA